MWIFPFGFYSADLIHVSVLSRWMHMGWICCRFSAWKIHNELQYWLCGCDFINLIPTTEIFHTEIDLRCRFLNPQHVIFYCGFCAALLQIFPISPIDFKGVVKFRSKPCFCRFCFRLLADPQQNLQLGVGRLLYIPGLLLTYTSDMKISIYPTV